MASPDPDNQATWPGWAPEILTERAYGGTLTTYREGMRPGGPAADSIVLHRGSHGSRRLVIGMTDPAFTCLPAAVRDDMDWLDLVTHRPSPGSPVTDAAMEWVDLAARRFTSLAAAGISPHGAVASAAWSAVRETTRYRLEHPLAAIGLVDVEVPARTVRAARCSDVEVWILRDGASAFTPLLREPRLTEEAAKALRSRMPRSDITGNREQVRSAHFATVESPSAWNSPNFGHVRQPPQQVATARDVAAIIVSTDGARLSPEVLAALMVDGRLASDAPARLRAYLEGPLQIRPPGHPHKFAHGDIAVAMYVLPKAPAPAGRTVKFQLRHRAAMARLRTAQRGFAEQGEFAYDPARHRADGRHGVLPTGSARRR